MSNPCVTGECRGENNEQTREISATELPNATHETSSCQTTAQKTVQNSCGNFSVATKSFALLPQRLIMGSIIAIFLILLLHIAALGVVLFAGNHSTNRVEATLLSSGLSIIGIAMAAWAGLNISNAVNAAHLSELQNNTQILQDTIAHIESETETLKQEADNLNGICDDLVQRLECRAKAIFHRMFLNEISCVQRDLPLQDLVLQFNQISDDPFDCLVKIELMYSQCSMRHKSEYSYDEFLINTALRTIKEIEEIDQETCSGIAKCYLEYRKYSLLFYMGYCDETYEKSAKNFLSVVKSHATLVQCFRDACVNLSPESKCYLANMIGEAQSKIVHYHLCSGGSKSSEFISMANQAVEDCSKSCGLFIALADDTLKSTYFRDYGCALERRERLTGEDNHAKIIEAYEQSLRSLINDVTCNIAARKNAYYVLLSYYKKYVDRNLQYAGQTIDIQATIESLNSRTDFLSDFIGIATSMARISTIAMSDFPSISSMHAFHGFSCAYQAILDLKNSNRESIAKYIAEIKTIKTDIELLGVNDLFCEQLGQWVEQLNACATEGREYDGNTVSVRDN